MHGAGSNFGVGGAAGQIGRMEEREVRSPKNWKALTNWKALLNLEAHAGVAAPPLVAPSRPLTAAPPARVFRRGVHVPGRGRAKRVPDPGLGAPPPHRQLRGDPC